MARILLHGGHVVDTTATRAQAIAALEAALNAGGRAVVDIPRTAATGGGTVTTYARLVVAVADDAV